MQQLSRTLERIDGRGYKAYNDIGGRHAFDRFTLYVDHVQADPFAAPSRMRALVPWSLAGLPESALSGAARRRAARDYLARAFAQASRDQQALGIDAGAQTVLDRTACLFTEAGVELRFSVHLPAAGRKILGRQAQSLLCATLPRVVRAAAEYTELDGEALERHCAAIEDQTALRAALAERDLVAFVADGAILPRRSGVDDRPLGDALAFQAPQALRCTIDTPNAGAVTGLGVPTGITLIVGGGFHGKSTLLSAVELGIYDHRPGDGRDQVVADPSAVKIRSEDGRAVSGVDLSPFINNLPFGQSTRDFHTELASGSTSQAAALQEGLEAGASTLLVDEDTSATNFMIRDERMQALVAKDHEPITPFVDRVRQLRDELGVSTLLVMGGSGDYFDCADTVIAMHAYQPHDVTADAHRIAASHVTGRREEHAGALPRSPPRHLTPRSIDPTTPKGKRKIQARGLDTLVFGRGDIDLRAVEQIADAAQVRAIGLLLTRLADERAPITDPPDWVDRALAADWDRLTNRPDGDLARPRTAEVMATLSRLRGARLARPAS
ncbi:MAG: isopentenyl-diphosphate delta-isomerase [Proteobacteria bacterium SW_6_67_9]|nr:MAG: isopentenyl-diphosphate delta-isomerase [Proteobacteria bacterium SW_6_67_9]